MILRAKGRFLPVILRMTDVAYLRRVEKLRLLLDPVVDALRRVGAVLPEDARVFIVHMRLHYQFFVLAGGYLFGALFVDRFTPSTFWWQFINVSVLLFGGATVYNSYYDKDTGPIGGLKNPPPMKPWMRSASLWMQFAGLLWAHYAGLLFTYLYLLSMVLFWLYSTPRARWKGYPIRSLVAIGVSTGSNSFWMGYMAAGGHSLDWPAVTAGIGVALVFLSLYPVSQLYQMRADSHRGDRTFAIEFGVDGVRRFFQNAYFLGVVLAGLPLLLHIWWLGLPFVAVGLYTGWRVRRMLQGIQGEPGEYDLVMSAKYWTSLMFTSFIVLSLLLIRVIR